jgi:hypothetical protein
MKAAFRCEPLLLRQIGTKSGLKVKTPLNSAFIMRHSGAFHIRSIDCIGEYQANVFGSANWRMHLHTQNSSPV